MDSLRFIFTLPYLLVAMAGLCGLAEGLYFHIGETERKCFIEEIPDDTMVKVNYKLQLYDPRTGGFMPSLLGLGRHVVVKDPDDRVMLSRVYGSEHQFTFTSYTPGEHVICLNSNSTTWFSWSKLRVHLDIRVGEQAVDYTSVVRREKLTKLQLRVRQLQNQVEQITKEQNYQRYREERFRQTSESTNQHILWWSVSQVTILAVGFWQLRLLKKLVDAHGAIVYILPAVEGVDESIISKHEEAQKTHLGALRDPTSQLLEKGDRTLITDSLTLSREEVCQPHYQKLQQLL